MTNYITHRPLPYLILLLVSVSMLLTSCKFKEETPYFDEQEVLYELYVKGGGDIKSLSRIIDCQPSALMRIMKGKTIATQDFKDKIWKRYSYYQDHDNNYRILRAEFDDEVSFMYQVAWFPVNHWIIFLVITVICIAIASGDGGVCLGIELAVFAIAWCWHWIFTSNDVYDSGEITSYEEVTTKGLPSSRILLKDLLMVDDEETVARILCVTPALCKDNNEISDEVGIRIQTAYCHYISNGTLPEPPERKIKNLKSKKEKLEYLKKSTSRELLYDLYLDKGGEKIAKILKCSENEINSVINDGGNTDEKFDFDVKAAYINFEF